MARLYASSAGHFWFMVGSCCCNKLDLHSWGTEWKGIRDLYALITERSDAVLKTLSEEEKK